MAIVLQPATKTAPFRGAVNTLAVSALLLSLPGCAMVPGTPGLSQVRIIDASPDAGAVDVYQGPGILAYNLGLGTLTSYIPAVPGPYSVAVHRAGTRQQMALAAGTFLANSQYTVVIGGYTTALSETVLKDQATPAPAGQVSFRILHQASRSGAVDLYLVPAGSTIASVRPVLSAVTLGQNTGYFTQPSGTYTLIALPAGTVPTSSAATSYTGSALTYASGAAKTVVLIDNQTPTPDSQPTPTLQVILATDFDPTAPAL